LALSLPLKDETSAIASPLRGRGCHKPIAKVPAEWSEIAALGCGIHQHQGTEMNIHIKQVVAAALSVCAALASTQTMAAKWAVLDLGTFDQLGALQIKNKGQVVGSYLNAAANERRIFVTDANGANLRDLLPNTRSGILGINDDGVTLSVMQTPEGRLAYATTTPSNPPQYSYFLDAPASSNNFDGVISNSGLIAVRNDAGSFEIKLSGGVSTALSDQGSLVAINKSGQVLMWGVNADGFLTGPNGVGGASLDTPSGMAHKILGGLNDAGQVVGRFYLVDRNPHAFITGPNGKGVVEIGTAGGAGSAAHGVNRFGHAVGTIYLQPTSGHMVTPGEPVFEGTHAFITSANGKKVRDLRTEVTLPTGYLTDAWGINDKGQVVAADSRNGKAYLLTPEPTCAVSYSVTSATSSKFTAKVTVSNLTAASISGWSVNWTYGASSTLSKASGASLAVAGNAVTATPTLFNASIQAKASKSFTFTGTNGIAAPTVNDLNALAGGEVCTVSVN